MTKKNLLIRLLNGRGNPISFDNNKINLYDQVTIKIYIEKTTQILSCTNTSINNNH